MSKRSEWIIEKTEAVSPDGMVTAGQPLAAEAGAEILRRGGNAIDAAIATAFAVGVVEPFMSGVGGIAFMTYREAASGKTYTLDGSANLPAAIRPEMFELLSADQRAGPYSWRATKDDAANTGWLSPAPPGMPGLMAEAHQRFGRLPWRDLLQPAIELADEGFAINHYVALNIAWNVERLSRFPESGRTFLRPSGAPLAPVLPTYAGDRLVQRDLARTLRLIAAEGAEVVYRGEIARLIAEDMARNGGLVTESDLAAHRTIVHEGAHTISYRGYEVHGQLENSGYATAAEALQILEGFDLTRLGYQSLAAVHLEIEAIRLAFVDRLRYLGDASLTPVPYRGVASAGYAAERRRTIDPARAAPDAQPGDPWPFETEARAWQPARSSAGGEGQTTHLTVIDRDHNMVSLTSTLGSAFGSAVVIKGTGITLNNATTWFDPEPGAVASVGPGKRIMSASTPVLVTRDGQPFLAIGAPGGRKVISAIYQCIVHAIDFKLGVQAAISAPRIHSEGRVSLVSSRFPSEVIEGLRRMGHEVVIGEDSVLTEYFARPLGVMLNSETGDLHGGVFQYAPATAVGA